MVQVDYSPVHGEKIKALLRNANLPDRDRPRVEAHVEKYDAWVASMNSLTETGNDLLEKLVSLLNDYKKSLDFDLIFCSENNFLYRQKGQLKLDNTVLEEFLPRLFQERLVPGFRVQDDLQCGPKKSFAGLSFENSIMPLGEGGVFMKKKDQDFSVTREFNIKISKKSNPQDCYNHDFHVSYFATEIKTNLDKTMFQEAAATAGELKRASPGSRYILLCEWLDMTPISTRLTAMDEVIVLRKAKRLSSNVRSEFSTADGRRARREFYEDFIDRHKLGLDGFKRFISYLKESFPHEQIGDEAVVVRGYF